MQDQDNPISAPVAERPADATPLPAVELAIGMRWLYLAALDRPLEVVREGGGDR
jgi:hypothetical protein